MVAPPSKSSRELSNAVGHLRWSTLTCQPLFDSLQPRCYSGDTLSAYCGYRGLACRSTMTSSARWGSGRGPSPDSQRALLPLCAVPRRVYALLAGHRCGEKARRSAERGLRDLQEHGLGRAPEAASSTQPAAPRYALACKYAKNTAATRQQWRQWVTRSVRRGAEASHLQTISVSPWHVLLCLAQARMHLRGHLQQTAHESR